MISSLSVNDLVTGRSRSRKTSDGRQILDEVASAALSPMTSLLTVLFD